MDDVHAVETELGEVEGRLRLDEVDRVELLHTADQLEPLIYRLAALVDDYRGYSQDHTVAMTIAKGRSHSAKSHLLWVKKYRHEARPVSLRRHLLWAAIAGQSTAELLLHTAQHGGMAARA